MTSVVTLVRDFEVQGNADFSEVWSLTDVTTGDSLLTLTSELLMELKDALADTVADLTIETEVSGPATGFVLEGDVATSGEFTIYIAHADLVTLLGDSQQKKFYYDLLVWDTSDPDQITTCYVKGRITILRGVTQRP